LHQIVKELCEFIAALPTCQGNFEGVQDLVCKRIAYKFEVEDSCKRCHDSGFNPASKLYEISYDSEEEHCYFNLEQDFMMDDIITTVSLHQ